MGVISTTACAGPIEHFEEKFTASGHLGSFCGFDAERPLKVFGSGGNF